MIKLIIDDNETKRSLARRNDIWLNKGSSVFLGCVFSTPYSITYYIIRGDILRVAWYFYVLEGAMKNLSNEQNGCLYYMLNHRIMDLLPHYYFCFFLILLCEIHPTALSVHHTDALRSTRKTKTTPTKISHSKVLFSKIQA